MTKGQFIVKFIKTFSTIQLPLEDPGEGPLLRPGEDILCPGPMYSPHVLPSLSPQSLAAHSEVTLGAAVAPAGDMLVPVATVVVLAVAVVVAVGR